ncbi:MAG: CPBP family intramembrane metalloprotease, partial [Chitinophagaceae bacterium]|nr:CPBP family intramembrane metalloprotease [Chitinophagaceae bacterium]
PADLSDFEFVRHNPVQLIFLLSIAWLLVIPYEEIIFRGFVLTTLRHLFNDTQGLKGVGSTFQGWRFWLAGLIQSVIFAAYHWQEGASAVISIFIGAVLTVWLYKIFRGNLWYLVFYHAAFDTVMLYLFAFGYL